MPAADVRGERRLVDPREAGQPGQVERDTTVHRDGPATHAASTCRRGHRHTRLVASRQRRPPPASAVSGRTTGAGSLGHATLGGPPDGQGPPVAPGLGPGVVVGHDRGPAGGDALHDGRRHVDDGGAEPVAHVGAGGVDWRDRGRRGHRRSSPAVRSSLCVAFDESVRLVGHVLLVPAHVRRDERRHRRGGVHRRLARAGSCARVRRDSTSSSVHAISSRAAYTSSRARVGQALDRGLEQLGTPVCQRQHRRRPLCRSVRRGAPGVAPGTPDHGSWWWRR